MCVKPKSIERKSQKFIKHNQVCLSCKFTLTIQIKMVECLFLSLRGGKGRLHARFTVGKDVFFASHLVECFIPNLHLLENGTSMRKYGSHVFVRKSCVSKEQQNSQHNYVALKWPILHCGTDHSRFHFAIHFFCGTDFLWVGQSKFWEWQKILSIQMSGHEGYTESKTKHVNHSMQVMIDASGQFSTILILYSSAAAWAGEIAVNRRGLCQSASRRRWPTTPVPPSGPALHGFRHLAPGRPPHASWSAEMMELASIDRFSLLILSQSL